MGAIVIRDWTRDASGVLFMGYFPHAYYFQLISHNVCVCTYMRRNTVVFLTIFLQLVVQSEQENLKSADSKDG